MKIVLLILLSFTMCTLPQETFKQSFLDEVANRYDDYVIVDDYSSPDYHLAVVMGVFEEQVSMGVCFFSETAKAYTLCLEVNNTIYYLSQNSRGDIMAPAIKNQAGITVMVFDKMNTIRREVQVDAMSVGTFYESSSFVFYPGAGIGGSFAALHQAISTLDIILWVAVGIIGISSIILFVFYKTKKGLFNPNRNQSNIFNFGGTLTEVSPQEDSLDEPDVSVLDEKAIFEGGQSRFPNQYKLLYDEEDEEDRNIEDILIRFNIPMDYTMLSLQEKNETMLKLMFMRDKKDITLQEYQKEVIKLWKKSQ